MCGKFCRYTFQSICWIHIVYWSIHLRHTRRISCNKSVRNHWRNDCITSIHLAGYLAKRNWSKLGVALCGRLGGDLGCQIGSECVFFLFIYLLIFLDGGAQGDTSHVFLSLRISFGIHTHTHRNLETYRHSIAGKQFFFLWASFQWLEDGLSWLNEGGYTDSVLVCSSLVSRRFFNIEK